MTDKKVPLDLSDMDAAPVSEEDGAGPDNALKIPAEAWMEGLAPEVTRRLQHLLELESQLDKLLEEIEALEAKYDSLYTERSKIVNGEEDVGSNTYETAEEATSNEKATKVTGIPDFWLIAMKNNEELARRITRRDEKALKFLKDIKCCTFGDQLKLKLDFYFDSNPFFENSILTRKCREIPSIGTKIDWLPGKRLTQVVPKKKSRQGLPQHNTRTKKCDSFFHFFGDCEDVIDFIGEDDDYNIRDILMYEIIPNAVSWYTGEASQKGSDETESAKGEGEAGNELEKLVTNIYIDHILFRVASNDDFSFSL